MAERIVDARLRAHPCCCIAPQQAAYQRGCRTEDVFSRLLDFTNRAWNKGHDAIYVRPDGTAENLHRSGRASVTLLDLHSAFDNVA